MDELILVWLDQGVYNSNRDELKNIMRKYGLVQNVSKTVGLNYKDIKEIYETFHFEDRLDEKLKNEDGISGIFEGGGEAVKIIIFDDVMKPALIVYKGTKGTFFKEFVELLVEVGGDVGQVVDMEGTGTYELIFRRRKNIVLSEKLRNYVEERKVLTENFIRKIKAEKQVGNMSSDEFIKGWVSLINKYGTITDKAVIEELGVR